MFTISNFITLFVAAIVQMGIGFIWYSPKVFGKQWLKYLAITQHELEERQKKMGFKFVLAFLLALVQAFVIDLLLGSIRVNWWLGGILVGFWLWLGLALVILANSYIYENKPIGYVILQAGYQLVAIVTMSWYLAVFSVN
jgi:hypothetical protein